MLPVPAAGGTFKFPETWTVRRVSKFQTFMKLRLRLVFRIGCVAILALIIGFFIANFWGHSMQAPLPASVQFLPDARPVPPPASLFERWVPFSWSWLWRLRDAIRGPRDTILISTVILECSADAEQTWIHELEGSMAETNGMRCWVLDERRLQWLQEEAAMNRAGKNLMWPRVQTSHGILSTISIGGVTPPNGAPNSGSLNMDVLTQSHGRGTALTTRLNFTEMEANASSQGAASTRTNLNFTLRCQLPIGDGVVIVGPSRPEGRTAIVLSVKSVRAR